MRVRRICALLGSAALVAICLAAPAVADPSETGLAHRNVAVCDRAPIGFAGCHAIRQDDIDQNGRVVNNGKPTAAAAPLTPADIRSAYNLTTDANSTVAIVDAYDDPTAEADLGVYRSQYSLPACTTSNGCFAKVNQSGGTTPPAADASWGQEISLDVDMVSATCPGCHILLVEANSNSFADLGAAVQYAASVGAVVAISNSYGGSDSSGTSSYDAPGKAVTASTGDNGYGVESPASYGSVVAVGGTTLKRAANTRGWAETAWSGAGSGCSSVNKAGWQVGTSCAGKANADVSAVADPNTGVAVYDSTPYQSRSGWMKFGGTSESSPIVASVYALAGNTVLFTLASPAAAYTWSHSAPLNDVTSGSNGHCRPAVLCTSGTGWDGPTGLGTPNGTSAF